MDTIIFFYGGGGDGGGVVHMQVDATVWNNKCHSSLKLFLYTLLSFTLLPHSHSLTFNQLPSLTHSQRTLSQLSYSL